MSKIFITSIPRNDTATGVHKWTNGSGKPMKKSKIGKTFDRVCALYSPSKGGLKNYISYTPWLDSNGKQKKDSEGNLLTLQDKMEKKWNKPKGYFTNIPRTREDVSNGVPETFFQRTNWVLKDGTFAIDLNTLEGELGHYVFLESKKVANSEKEWRAHKFPYATHFISHENESSELKYKKTAIKSKAFAALHDKVLTLIMKKKVATVLELIQVTIDITDEQIHNLLFDYIDRSGYGPNSNIERLLSIVKSLKTADGKEEFEARYTLKTALDTRVVYEKQGTYTWVRPEGKLIIGDKYDEAVDFILNPKKSSLVEALQEQIKFKL